MSHVFDCDLFIFADIESRGAREGTNQTVAQGVMERVSGGGKFVVVVDDVTAGLGFLQWPVNPRVLPAAAERVLVDDSYWGRAFERHAAFVEYVVDWERGVEGSFVTTPANRSVACATATSLFLPPTKRDQPRFVAELLEANVGWLPISLGAPPAEDVPEWASDLRWERQATLAASAEAARIRVEEAIVERELADAALRRESRWAALLTGTGTAELEPVVRDALSELGVQAEPTPFQDLQVKTEAVVVVIEVTGSSNAIGVNKGRQLLDWVAREEERVLEANEDRRVVGVLVGNGYRNLDPSSRGEQFAPNLKTFASSHSLRLFTTGQLFALVTSDEPDAAVKARALLGLD